MDGDGIGLPLFKFATVGSSADRFGSAGSSHALCKAAIPAFETIHAARRILAKPGKLAVASAQSVSGSKEFLDGSIPHDRERMGVVGPGRRCRLGAGGQRCKY